MQSTNTKVFEDDINILANKKEIFEGLRRKTILITGATGLIGKMLVFSLARASTIWGLEIKVIALSRNLNRLISTFSSIQKSKDLIFMVGNIEELDSLNFDGTIDIVIHAAANTSSFDMVHHPINLISSIYDGTKNILNFSSEHSVKKFVYLSSMEVYGTTTESDGEINEDFYGKVPLNSLRSSYPEAKRLSEILVNAYGSEKNFETVIIRLTQTFGSGVTLTDNRVFAAFTKQAISNDDIILKTEGLTIRSYLYVRDAISGILHLLKYSKNREAYNISNENATISIIDFAKLIKKITSSKSKIVIRKESDEDTGFAPTLSMILDNNKILQTGWIPEVQLDEMIKLLSQQLREQMESKF